MHVYLDEVVISVEKSVSNHVDVWQNKWYIILYVLVGGIMLYQLIWQFLQIQKIKSSHKTTKYNNYTLIHTTGKLTHFSFFKQVFINQEIAETADDMKRIIKHEETHVRQWHSVDVMLLEILKIAFWFNPFVWLFKPFMLNNHEYLADQRVVSLGEDKSDYLGQIVNHSLTNYSLSLINNFNYSLTKKRIVMMTKHKIKWLSGIKITAMVAMVSGLVVVFACTENPVSSVEENIPENSESVFYVVETMPVFKNGGIEGFQSFIAENLVYPEEALNNEVEGKVFIEFIVSDNGSIKDAKVVRSVHPLLDEEALRVVNASPSWEPGIQRGEKVNVQFTFPINFRLN
jgi:TonB family protein